MFQAIRKIDEDSFVAAVFDKTRQRDVLVLIEFDDEGELMLTNAAELTEDSPCDEEFLRSFFSDEYAAEYRD